MESQKSKPAIKGSVGKRTQTQRRVRGKSGHYATDATASCIQRLEIAKFQELSYKNVTLWEKADRLLLLLVLTHPGEILRNLDTLSVIKLCLLGFKTTITQYLFLLNVNFLLYC